MIALDLVTMPLIEISLFMSSGFRSLMTLCSFKLNGRTCTQEYISRHANRAVADVLCVS